ncbi:MAG: YciI family protein [Kofleriaceae bacterium]
MKYLLMMHTPERGPYEILTSWSKQDLEAHMAFMRRFNQQLREAGELVGGAGLSGPDQAKVVRAGADGQPITDGVFPEAKEFLAGYWIIDVDRAERAYALAAEASMAPGQGGKPLHMQIEVRQVMFTIDPQG